MKAVMKKDDYSDLILDYQYTVKRVFADGHIMLEGSPRRYLSGSFIITDDHGKRIYFKEAYRRYCLENVKIKLGF